MNSLARLLISSVAMVLGSLFFGFVPLWLQVSKRKLSLATAFGAGLLIGVAFMIIIPEGVETIQEAKQGSSSRPLGIAMLSGFLFMLLVDQFSNSHHSHHAVPDSNTITMNRVHTMTPTLGFTIHAAADGIAMGAAFLSDKGHTGWIVFVAVMLHKAPAAFGLSTFLLAKDMPRNSVYRSLTIFACAAPIAAVVTFCFFSFLPDNQTLSLLYRTGLLLLFSAGTFLYVAAVHVLPEIYNQQEIYYTTDNADSLKTLSGSQIFSLLAGALVPIILSMAHD